MIEVLSHIPDELDVHFDSDTCAPTFAELNELANIDDVEMRVVVVRENGTIVACLPCYAQTRRHHGLNVKVYSSYSGALHDYQRLLCMTEVAAIELTIGIIADARLCGCDIICIDSVLPDVVIPKGFHSKSEIKIFNSIAEKRGWQELYVRRSVKRDEHYARKTGNYHVEVIDGLVDSTLMNELRDLHILRWQFAGNTSAFKSNDKRISQYICHPENKHYLRIMLGDEILSCHYGMRYGKTLLFHTPVINPKYMKLSPLRLLLAEEARYCEANGLKKIDFGLGDESYKDGYCHTVRETLTFVKSLTLEGYLSALIGKMQTPFVKTIIGKVLVFARFVKHRIFDRKECWVYFQASAICTEYSDPQYVEADSWRSMYDLARKYDFQVYEWHYKRFKEDGSCRFVGLADDSNILSFGWVSDNNRSLLEGKQYEGRILYDFQTPLQFRGKGYYTRLLKHLASNGGGIIYADKHNIASLKAIRKAGFEKL